MWPGKYDEQGRRTPIPDPHARLLDDALLGPAAQRDEPDRLIHGDNLAALAALRASFRDSIDLVYIDPPFATGGSFEVASRVGRGGAGRGHEISLAAYSDRFEGGLGGFLSMLDPRLRLIHDLLAPDGSLYVHVDPTVGHAVKLLLDEIFGPECFQREIVWRIGWVSGFKTRARNWIRNHDLLFFYVKDPRRFTFNKRYIPYPPGYRRRDGALPKGKGMPIDDVWNAAPAEFELRGPESLDSIQIKSFSTEKTGYATQKNESVLRRIIEASSNPGDWVLDAFCGSGTTLVAAQQLDRRFIGCDVGAPALHIAEKRLLERGLRRPLRVQRVEVRPDAMRSRESMLLAAHQAEATGGAFARRGEAAVVVLGPDTPLTLARLHERAEVARREGWHELHVIATTWDLPLDRPRAIAGVELAIFDGARALGTTSHTRLDPLFEVPRVDVKLEATEDAYSLFVAHYGFDHPEWLDPKLIAGVEEFTDFIDAVELVWEHDGRGVRGAIDESDFRTLKRRELRASFGPRAWSRQPAETVSMRLVDVRFTETRLLLEVHRDGEIPTELRLSGRQRGALLAEPS